MAPGCGVRAFPPPRESCAPAARDQIEIGLRAPGRQLTICRGRLVRREPYRNSAAGDARVLLQRAEVKGIGSSTNGKACHSPPQAGTLPITTFV